MDTVTHREMRNSSGALLRRVEAGESVQISNGGSVIAMMVPVSHDMLGTLVSRGQARAPRTPLASLASIQRVTSDSTTSAMIDDARGRW
jgi:antitoxin (DNA-binding transcriptional repressor) of toxin-antitoxin stability system